MKRHIQILSFAVTALVAIALCAPTVHAQIDPMRQSVGIYQSSPGVPPTLAGEIVREGTDPTTYAEHWVLYPNYVYPNGTNGIITSLRPGLTTYTDVHDFFANVHWTTGTRYVRVDVVDTNVRPTAR